MFGHYRLCLKPDQILLSPDIPLLSSAVTPVCEGIRIDAVLPAVFFLTQTTGRPSAEMFVSSDRFLLIFHTPCLAWISDKDKMGEMSAYPFS
jgi:hypothetical protein